MTQEQLIELGFTREVFWWELKIYEDIELCQIDGIDMLNIRINNDCSCDLPMIKTVEKAKQLIKILSDE